MFYIYQRCSGLTLEAIIRKYFNPHAKLRNDVLLVRDFVRMHYQLSAKVMDPNFRSRVAKEIEFNPIRPGGGGLRGPDGQTHSCQSETSYPMMPKLGDF